ncbi:hypothetical protein FRC12_004596 [Ceratobasidium sp. 428]|nr:hypothetical protein FRC12_004596 [Ceratobasidium sp. 428]
MKLRLVAALSLSSTLVCAYQPRVYLLPTRGMLTGKHVVSDNTPPSLSLPQANKVLANHLGFDKFESIEDIGESKGWQHLLHGGLDALLRTGDRPPRSTVMLVLHTDHPEDVLSLPSRDPLPQNPDFYINGTLSTYDVSALISTYVTHARGNFDTVSSGVNWFVGSSVKFEEGFDINAEAFKVPGESAKLFLDEYTAIEKYKEGPWDENTKFPLAHGDNYEPSDFAAFEISSLDLLAEEYGRSSEQYQLATQIVRNWLDVPNWNGDDILSVIIKPRSSPEGHTHQARSIAAPIERRAGSPGSLPIYSCFKDATTCGNATSACSGRGSCVSVLRAGRTCFTCKCSSTKSDDGMTTTHWAGQRCERKDVSSSFVLLAGTVLGVIFVAFGSVALLYGVGDEKLPGTLTGGAVHGTKHD